MINVASEMKGGKWTSQYTLLGQTYTWVNSE